MFEFIQDPFGSPDSGLRLAETKSSYVGSNTYGECMEVVESQTHM